VLSPATATGRARRTPARRARQGPFHSRWAPVFPGGPRPAGAAGAGAGCGVIRIECDQKSVPVGDHDGFPRSDVCEPADLGHSSPAPQPAPIPVNDLVGRGLQLDEVSPRLAKLGNHPRGQAGERSVGSVPRRPLGWVLPRTRCRGLSMPSPRGRGRRSVPGGPSVAVAMLGMFIALATLP
jgi:hypothetical protein